MEIDEIETFKILIVGNASVGKTSFLLQFVEGIFPDKHISTIGVDSKFKNIRLNERIIRLQIWDTAGQDKFKSLTKNYFKGSDGIIVMYDVTSQNSFIDCRNWISQIKDNVKNLSVMLIANKIDIKTNIAVDKRAGVELAREHGILFFETSAKDNINITEAFVELARQLISNTGFNRKSRGFSLNHSRSRNEGRSCCY